MYDGKNRILTIGGATQDIFITYANTEMMHLQAITEQRSFIILEEGKKIEITDLQYRSGGGATNSAFSFKRLGFQVSIFCKLGTDSAARLILQELKNEGINADHCIQIPTKTTGTSFIFPSLSGDSAILAYRGSNTHVVPEDFSPNLFKNLDAVYITSLSGSASQTLPYITQQAKKHNLFVATNPGSSQLGKNDHTLKEALANIDILILNGFEAKLFMKTLTMSRLTSKKYSKKSSANDNSLPTLLKEPLIYHDICFNLRDFFTTILAYGPRTVAVTNGADGVYVANNTTIYYHPSIAVPITNTVGAGDAFGSCFVAHLIKKSPLEEALICGIINSASVISHVDAKTGLLTNNEIKNRFAQISTKNLLTYALAE